MIILKYFIIILGLFEVISNAVHLSKGSISSIGKSARKQHQEIPLDLPDQHFFIKAIIMFLFGILMLISGLLTLFHLERYVLLAGTCVCLFGIYGVIQAIIYRKEVKVWPAALVYNVPLIFMIIFKKGIFI